VCVEIATVNNYLYRCTVHFVHQQSVQYPCSTLQPATRIPHQPSHTETPKHIETRTHDQCGDSIEKSQVPDDGCINVRNMLSMEEVK